MSNILDVRDFSGKNQREISDKDWIEYLDVENGLNTKNIHKLD